MHIGTFLYKFEFVICDFFKIKVITNAIFDCIHVRVCNFGNGGKYNDINFFLISCCNNENNLLDPYSNQVQVILCNAMHP